MSEAMQEAVVCTGCGKSYRAKPELAGRKAKCKCGETVRFPAAVAAAGAAPVGLEPLDNGGAGGAYDVAETAKPVAAPPRQKMGACKGCTAPLAAGAVLCTKCGMNQTTGKKLSTSVAKGEVGMARPVATPTESEGKWWLEWLYLVGAVAAVGVLMGIWVASSPKSGTEYSGYVAIGGIVIWGIGTIWGIRMATQDNFMLRLLCRIVPFVGWYMIIRRSIEEWGEMKTPVMVLAFGFGVTTAAGICWFIGNVMIGVAHGGG